MTGPVCAVPSDTKLETPEGPLTMATVARTPTSVMTRTDDGALRFTMTGQAQKAEGRPAIRITLDDGRTLRVGGEQILFRKGMQEVRAREVVVGDELESAFVFPEGYAYQTDDGREAKSSGAVAVSGSRARGRGRSLQLSRPPDRALRLQRRGARQGRGLVRGGGRRSRGAEKPASAGGRVACRRGGRRGRRLVGARHVDRGGGLAVREVEVDVGQLDAVAFLQVAQLLPRIGEHRHRIARVDHPVVLVVRQEDDGDRAAGTGRTARRRRSDGRCRRSPAPAGRGRRRRADRRRHRPKSPRRAGRRRRLRYRRSRRRPRWRPRWWLPPVPRSWKTKTRTSRRRRRTGGRPKMPRPRGSGCCHASCQDTPAGPFFNSILMLPWLIQCSSPLRQRPNNTRRRGIC